MSVNSVSSTGALTPIATRGQFIQYSTMPTASADIVNKIVQYTGTTNQNYTNGYFYKCTLSGSNYIWTNINVQAGGSDNIVNGYFNPTDNLFYEESTYTTAITGENNVLYISLDTDFSYRYNGSIFVRVDKEIDDTTTSSSKTWSSNKISNDAYLTNDTAETTLSDDDYVPFYDTSATAKRKTLWSNIKSVLSGLFCKISAIATNETGTTASKAYAIGEHFYKNGKFCTAKAAIAQGATFTLGTNYIEGMVADFTNSLHYRPVFNNNSTGTGFNVLYGLDVWRFGDIGLLTMTLGIEGGRTFPAGTEVTICTISEAKFIPTYGTSQYQITSGGTTCIIRMDTAGKIYVKPISGNLSQYITASLPLWFGTV